MYATFSCTLTSEPIIAYASFGTEGIDDILAETPPVVDLLLTVMQSQVNFMLQIALIPFLIYKHCTMTMIESSITAISNITALAAIPAIDPLDNAAQKN